jgi:hypothetical protein
MEIEGTTFGTITIDGKTYEYDVILRLSGDVVKRKIKLSKKYYDIAQAEESSNPQRISKKNGRSGIRRRRHLSYTLWVGLVGGSYA